MRGTVDGRGVIVGRDTLFAGYGMTAPASLAARCRAWEEAGCTAVLTGWDGEIRGAIAVADTPSRSPRSATSTRSSPRPP